MFTKNTICAFTNGKDEDIFTVYFRYWNIHSETFSGFPAPRMYFNSLFQPSGSTCDFLVVLPIQLTRLSSIPTKTKKIMNTCLMYFCETIVYAKER